MKATPYVIGGLQRVILSADRDLKKTEQSVFLVAPLTVDELYVHLDKDGSERLQNYLALVCAQLREVRNFPAGAPQPYPLDGTLEQKKAYVAQLGVSGVLELGIAIVDQAFVTDNGPESD